LIAACAYQTGARAEFCQKLEVRNPGLRVPIVRAGKLAKVGQPRTASHNRLHLPRHCAKKRSQRSAMVSPAIHTLGSDTTMHLCSYQLRFQTPAFLGNAQQQGQWRTRLFWGVAGIVVYLVWAKAAAV
jgi:hypothetical protein